jgi:murein DD-endopeptidase MepM/ murein hydrolase activator NlpD
MSGTDSDVISIYIVHSGDTLPTIAKMFGVSVNTIIWANDLSKNAALKPGQTLTILPVSGVKYTVKRGDTIARIAKKFNADEREIMQFNGIDDGASLIQGDDIIIPNGEIKEAPAQPKQTGNSISSGTYKPVPNGYFIRPVLSCLLTQGLHGHNGVDLGCPIGTPVFAAAAGTIIVADPDGYNGGYGKYIVIKHGNGTQTLYAHLSSIFISVGQEVNQGDRIGSTGNTGRSTGPHLHFEVRGGTNFIAVNPRYGL